MVRLKLKITGPGIEYIRKARTNRNLTREMQQLLAGIESPYRRITWSINENTVQSQPLANGVCETVRNALEEAGVKCKIVTTDNAEQSTISINTDNNPLNIQEILGNHREKVLRNMSVPEDAQPLKALVQAIDTAWDSLAKKKPGNTFELLKDAPPIIIDIAEKIDTMFIGLRSSKIKKSNSETAVLSSVYYTNMFMSIFAKASPDLFRAAFKKTPLGPIFIAGYQIANDAFYAKKWLEGRGEHQFALFSTGYRVQELSNLYIAASELTQALIEREMKKLKDITGHDDQTLNDLIENDNMNLVYSLDPEKREDALAIVNEIKDLKTKLKEAQKSTKEISTELRKKASRINTNQQVMMATKHIDRFFNIAFIGLGIGSFFFPPLAIPTIIIGLGKGLTQKKLEDRIREGTEIVQGIYDFDDTVVLTRGKNKAAMSKARDLKKMVLQFAPVALVGVKLGITKKGTFERILKLIRSNPEYSLYIPSSFNYQALGVSATRRQIRGQISSYSTTCQYLIYHLGVIEGRNLQGQLPKLSESSLHPPTITNINELKDLINDWSENLIQQIRDEQLNPQSGKSSYFTDTQIQTIQDLRKDAMLKIDAYQFKIEELDRAESPQGQKVKVKKFDMDYAKKMHQLIIDETTSVKEILSANTDEQRVVNGEEILQRLEKRMNSLFNYCDKSPNESDKEIFRMWKEVLQKEIKPLKKQLLAPKTPKNKPVKSPSEQYHGIEVEPSKNTQVAVPVQNPRFFENRSKMVETLKNHVSQRKKAMQGDETPELVLLPASKVTTKVLFNYKSNFWKMMWLVRGIDRAIESVELAIKNKGTIGAEMSVKNLDSLLKFYKNQLKKIEDYSPNFTFSKSAQDIVKKRITQAVVRVETLITENQQRNPEKPKSS